MTFLPTRARSLRTALLCLWIIVPASARSAPPSPAEFVQRNLPSGLQLLVAERPRAALVAFDLRVRGGSGDETEPTSGTAHLVEHLLFKGSAARAPGQLDTAMEALGGEIAARTARDTVQYAVTVPAARWREALNLLAELLLRPALRDDDLAAEKPVVRAEIALLRSDPARAGTQALAATLYGALDPYRLPLMGPADNVARLTASDLKAFWSAWYRPSRMVLAVAGAVDAGQVAEAAAALFKGPASAPTLRPPRRALPPAAPARAPMDPALAASAQTLVLLGWVTPPAADLGATAALTVLAEAMVRGERGRLAGPLVREKRLALAVEAENLLQRAGGLFVLRLACLPGKAARAEAEAVATLRRLAEDGFADGEAEAAREAALAQIAAEEATVEGTARRLALFAGLEALPLAAELKRRIATVTAEELRQTLKEYLSPGRCGIAWVGAAAEREEATP